MHLIPYEDALLITNEGVFVMDGVIVHSKGKKYVRVRYVETDDNGNTGLTEACDE